MGALGLKPVPVFFLNMELIVDESEMVDGR
jgi:hypothetical protein